MILEFGWSSCFFFFYLAIFNLSCNFSSEKNNQCYNITTKYHYLFFQRDSYNIYNNNSCPNFILICLVSDMQCLCKIYVFGVKLKNIPAFYIENAQEGLCKAKLAKFAK